MAITKVKCPMCQETVQVSEDASERYAALQMHKRICTGRTPEKQQQATAEREKLIREFDEQKQLQQTELIDLAPDRSASGFDDSGKKRISKRFTTKPGQRGRQK
jgi:uncharacterized Zn finger protein (UPF0148 family)